MSICSITTFFYLCTGLLSFYTLRKLPKGSPENLLLQAFLPKTAWLLIVLGAITPLHLDMLMNPGPNQPSGQLIAIVLISGFGVYLHALLKAALPQLNRLLPSFCGFGLISLACLARFVFLSQAGATLTTESTTLLHLLEVLEICGLSLVVINLVLYLHVFSQNTDLEMNTSKNSKVF